MDDLGASRLDPQDDPADRPADAQADDLAYSFTGKLQVVTEPDSLTAESIRALRTVLLAQHLHDGRRSLAICAPSPGAGCSFLAANLAVAMSQVGVNTLLVDANLRDPSIQDYIAPSRPASGLSECLGDDTLAMGAVFRTIQPSLSVLYAGHASAAAQDQIGGNVFKSIISSCIRDYDLTIIDTPPANRYADARRIASVARYALVTACRQRTYVKDVRTLLNELETDRTTIVGTYLNDY